MTEESVMGITTTTIVAGLAARLLASVHRAHR
jgi:hypothetical protein